MAEEQTACPSRRPPSGRPYARLWLVTKAGTGPVETLTLECGGDDVLPVFSHEEEAALFLNLSDAGDGWRVRESAPGEVVSLLTGFCSGVRSVALDPLPGMPSEMIGLVRVSRDRFVDLICSPGRTIPSDGWGSTLRGSH